MFCWNTFTKLGALENMDKAYKKLEIYREKLRHIDQKIIALLSERAEISEGIGMLKFHHNIEIKQDDYWEQASEMRKQLIGHIRLSDEFVNTIFQLIQKQSIQIQKDVSQELQNEQK